MLLVLDFLVKWHPPAPYPRSTHCLHSTDRRSFSLDPCCLAVSLSLVVALSCVAAGASDGVSAYPWQPFSRPSRSCDAASWHWDAGTPRYCTGKKKECKGCNMYDSSSHPCVSGSWIQVWWLKTLTIYFLCCSLQKLFSVIQQEAPIFGSRRPDVLWFKAPLFAILKVPNFVFRGLV